MRSASAIEVSHECGMITNGSLLHPAQPRGRQSGSVFLRPNFRVCPLLGTPPSDWGTGRIRKTPKIRFVFLSVCLLVYAFLVPRSVCSQKGRAPRAMGDRLRQRAARGGLPPCTCILTRRTREQSLQAVSPGRRRAPLRGVPVLHKRHPGVCGRRESAHALTRVQRTGQSA